MLLNPLTAANIGRSTRIRTLDPLVPNQVRYRAAPHSEKGDHTGLRQSGQLIPSLRLAFDQHIFQSGQILFTFEIPGLHRNRITKGDGPGKQLEW